MADDPFAGLLPDETIEEDPTNPGFLKHTSPDGSVYYTPKPGYVPQQQDTTAGTPLEPSEIPIPKVSLPDVPKDVPPTQTSYEEKPVDPSKELEALVPTSQEERQSISDAFDAAAKRVRRGVVRDRPLEPPEQPTSSERDFIEGATAPLRFGAAAVGKGIAGTVYGLPAALAELGSLIEENIPKGESDLPSEDYMRAAGEWLRQAEATAKAGVEKVTGTANQKPVTPLEKGLYWTGEYFVPAKGISVGATVGLAGAGALLRGALTRFGPSDVPIPSVGTAQAQSYLPEGFGTPGAPQPKPAGPPVKVAPTPGAPKVPAPIQPGTMVIPDMPNEPYVPPKPGALEKPSTGVKTPKEGAKPKKERAGTSAPVVPEGMIIPPPNQRKTAKPNLQPIKDRKGNVIETQDAFDQRVENAWVGREIKIRNYTPTAQEIFRTIAGLEFMSPTEYKVMGAVLGTFVGSLLFSVLRKKYTKVELPIHRSVETAAPGTAAISVPSDLARAYDDINAPLARIARRAGVDPTVLNRLMQTFRIQTRNGARALADSAVAEGVIETPAFRFKAPASLREMGRRSTPETDAYLKALAQKDALIADRNEAVAKAAEGFRTGRLGEKAAYERRAETASTTQEINALDQTIKDMEAANPELVKMGEANRGWNKAMTDFRESGEYGTLTKKEADRLRMSQTNELGGKATDDAIKGQSDKARQLIKERLDNEAVGKYVDEMRKADESLFVFVGKGKDGKAALDANPEWANNVVKFKRNGEMEYYTTDRLIADVIKADHHQITGNLNVMYSTKRMLEATTTGNLAPQFAPTSAIRSYWIAKFTTDQGFSAPGAIGSIMAIPQQLVPQIARSLARGLENGMGGLADAFMTPQLKEGLVRRLTTVFDESLYAQMKAAGGSHRGAFIEQQYSNNAKALNWAQQQWDNATANSNLVAGAGHFWNAWKASLEAIHNAPAFAFVSKNLEREALPSLALRGRRLTGDPRTGGEFYTGGGQSRQAIKFESNNKFDQAVADTLVKAYGFSMEAAKSAVPWWNPTLQGAKRIGEAYLDNPVRFHMAAAQLMAFETGLFYYNKALGLDPNGKSYFDHYMFGRSSYASQMNFGIGIPGLPVEYMIEFPFFHELNPVRSAIRIALHHMLGRNIPPDDPMSFLMGLPPEGDNVTARNSVRHDLWNAAWNFIETTVIPPMPPPINAALGMFGIRGPQGVFGGEARPVKGDPFNQNGGLSQSLEIMTRALWGGVAEAFGTFVANATQTETGIIDAVKNGSAGVGELIAKRTPVIRNVLGILPDRSNNTDMAQEVFDLQHKFNEMDRFYKKWDVKGGAINITPASKAGGVAVAEQYGLQQLTPGNPGLNQRPPDNPLYIEFMNEFHNRFMKESPTAVKGEDQGGVAFRSLWRNYGTATQKLERLKNVNFGTYDRWQREMDPEARTELEQNGVDTTDRREVVNFYRRQQQDALRVINYVRRSTEYIMSQRAGQEIRLKDLSPYLSPIDRLQNALQPPAPFMFQGDVNP